jgi:hypothetical protein
MTSDNFCFYLQNRLFQTSLTGGQWYSDTSPFSFPWSVCPSKVLIFLSVHLSKNSGCLSALLSLGSSVHLPDPLSVCLSINPFVCPYLHVWMYLFLCVCISYVYISAAWLLLRLSVCPPVCPCKSVSLYLALVPKFAINFIINSSYKLVLQLINCHYFVFLLLINFCGNDR